jgi:hypothetical protein
MTHEAIQRLVADYREAGEDAQAQMAALGQLLIAYGPSSSTAVRQQAGSEVYRLLEPLARPEAERAARHLPANDREDFVAVALNHVFVHHGSQGMPRVCAFRTEGSTPGRLVCWFRQVFHKLMLSARRKARRTLPASGLNDWQPVCDGRPEPAEQIHEPEWRAPLSEGDLEELAGLSPLLRVKLVAITAAWLRVPAGTWEHWLDEYAQVCGVELERPCPPLALIASPNVNQFFQGLAVALGTSVGSLHGVKYQQLPRFRSRLDYLGD